jgi:hypothetical protein
MKAIGYDRALFVQPFDHRGSFTKTFFDFKGAPKIEPDRDQHVPVTAAKTLIYRALIRAIEMGVPRDEVGVLVDAQFGSHIIADAKSRAIPAAVCVEKSGQDVFDFEYGSRWEDHLRFLAPDIVKCLVRYHPQDDASLNREQLTRLKLLSDYIHAVNDHYLMFELLVPAVTEEDKKAGDRYDSEIRPKHMIEAIEQIQDFGVSPTSEDRGPRRPLSCGGGFETGSLDRSPEKGRLHPSRPRLQQGEGARVAESRRSRRRFHRVRRGAHQLQRPTEALLEEGAGREVGRRGDRGELQGLRRHLEESEG